MAICKSILDLWWLGKITPVTSLLRILFTYKHIVSIIFLPVLEGEQL